MKAMSAALFGLTTAKDWASDEVEALESAGHLAGCRFELIKGALIDKMGQKPLDAGTVALLTGFLTLIFGDS